MSLDIGDYVSRSPSFSDSQLICPLTKIPHTMRFVVAPTLLIAAQQFIFGIFLHGIVACNNRSWELYNGEYLIFYQDPNNIYQCTMPCLPMEKTFHSNGCFQCRIKWLRISFVFVNMHTDSQQN